jgi:hypothetical protein
MVGPAGGLGWHGRGPQHPDLVTIKLSFERVPARFRAAVDIKIEFAAKAVFGVLAVLAHHDYSEPGLKRAWINS